MSSGVRDERTEAEAELARKLLDVDLSAPSGSKFTDVRAWAAARAGLEPHEVAVYWVSKPGNLEVRFQQPGVLRDKPRLGLALVPSSTDYEGYVRPARRLIENGLFEGIAICAQRGREWDGIVALKRVDSTLDSTFGGLVSTDELLEVEPVEPLDESTTAALVAHGPLEPSGLDVGGPMGWGEYPLDSVFVRSETRTVSEVVRRISAGRYQLDPDFQRDFVWPVEKQSRLIESCVMRIPLPVFYVAEAKDGRILVVDGLQRLTTFSRFINNQLSLYFGRGDDAEPKNKHPLSGKKFSDLAVSMAERIEDTQLTLYILDAKAPERAKLDIFERVNSGVPLSRQQMRNCLYSGEATRWLKESAASDVFLQATGGSLSSKTMRDREAINRFCAFHMLGWEDYKSGDIDSYLADALTQMNGASARDMENLRHDFTRSMNNNVKLFGVHSFRKSLATAGRDAPRTVINIALFDVCSVIFATVGEDVVDKNAPKLRAALQHLINDHNFNHAITYSTNSTRQVQYRFARVKEAVAEALK